MPKTLLPDRLYMEASVEVRSNGVGAKSVPVRIVANTGKPVEYPGFGQLIFDLSSMTHKARIPLDLDHDFYTSCGYLNRFEMGQEGLVVSGAIVPFKDDDYYSQLVHQLDSGVPFQASVQSNSYELEFVEQGTSVSVNNQQIDGPAWVVRNWELSAVAICKWGKDDDTSVSLAASKQKSAAKQKVVFVRASESPQTKEPIMAEETKPTVESEAPAAEEKVDETSDKKEPEKAETKASPDVVDAVDSENATPATVATSADPRAEFKLFAEAFGLEQGAKYYAEGLSLVAAGTAFTAALKAENDDLKKRLSVGANAGMATAPIAFGDRAESSGQANKPSERLVQATGSTGLAAFAAGIKLPK